jgi:hypothetical protein
MVQRVRNRSALYTTKWAWVMWRSWLYTKWRTEEALYQVMDEI